MVDDITIISSNACPFAQRSRITLTEKGVEFTLTEIDLENKPDWFEDVSPYSMVPVLQHAGNTIYESAIVNEYLEEVFPEPALMPADPGKRAQVRAWVDFANTKFVPAFYKLILSQEIDRQDHFRDVLLGHLRFMESEGIGALGGTGADGSPYFIGEELSLADITFYPHFERFCIQTHYRELAFPDDCPRLAAWHAAIQERPAMVATSNPQDYYLNHYLKYANNTVNGVSARAMRES